MRMIDYLKKPQTQGWIIGWTFAILFVGTLFIFVLVTET